MLTQDGSNSSAQSFSQLELVRSSEQSQQNSRKIVSGARSKAVHQSNVLQGSMSLRFSKRFLEKYLIEALGDKLVACGAPSNADNGEILRYSLVDDTDESSLVIWVRSAEARGICSWSDALDTEPFSMAILNTSAFLEALVASTSGVDFPQLRTLAVEAFQNAPFSAQEHKVLALIDVDRHCVAYQRKLMKAGRAGVSVVDLVDSATSYLLYELDVEVVVFKRTADFCDYLLTFTRMASSRVPDEMAVVTEIDCVAKTVRDKAPEGLSAREAEAFELRQTWSAMLQAVPGMSRERAQTLLQDPDCTCPRKLRRMFHSADSGGQAAELEGRMLRLQGKFGKTKTGKVSNRAKLSKLLYQLVTATDENGSIS